MLNALLQSLNIDPVVIVMNVGLFLVLLTLMNLVFWRPIMAHLEVRKEQIKGAHAQVDQTRRDMEALRGEYEHRIAEIEAEARGAIQKTVRSAQAQREEMLAKARAEADALLLEGKAGVRAEHEQASEDMRSRLDDMALLILAKATGGAPSPEQERLVDDYIRAAALPGGRSTPAG